MARARSTHREIFFWKPRICQILEKANKYSSSLHNMIYDKCNSCGGRVEVWYDEDTGVCLDCGTKRVL
jgi:hypothetical protein